MISRWFLFWVAMAVCAGVWGTEKPAPETFVYKEVDGLGIELDVYRGGVGSGRPVVVWIHGGALIGGGREGIRADQLNAYLEAGYVVVSIDYRLAPETKLPAIAEDVRDALLWVRNRGAEIAGIDPDRMAVIGHSAGGYLALLSATLIEPPPQAIVSFYGYGDLVGDWYAKPDPFYLLQDRVSEAEALASVGNRPLASDKDFEGNRFRFYLHCRQNGLWPEKVGGVSPTDNPEFFRPYCPLPNVAPGHPPTLLIHGDADTDVPVEQSLLMGKALKAVGAPLKTMILKGAGHGFDGKGIDKDDVVWEVFEQVVEFLWNHLSEEESPDPESPLPPLPPLPRTNGSRIVSTQEWPLDPGPRTIRVYVHYPNGSIENLNEDTGLMLSLHNWGGIHETGTPDPDFLANRYNVVCLCVDYLQSGAWKSGGKPYDFGMYQAIDALRAVDHVRKGLTAMKAPFDAGRIHACGGSGGGNVAMMAAKFAPRTFASVVNLSGMAKLTENIAFGEEGGSPLDAGFNRDPNHPAHLTEGAMDLRFIGHPGHLQTMKERGCETHFILSHGADDQVCPTDDVRELASNFEAAGLSIEAHFIEEKDLDGKIFTDTGHSVGDRTLILQRLADPFLLPDSDRRRVLEGPTDLDLPDDPVRYEVTGGAYVIRFGEEGPTLDFHPEGSVGKVDDDSPAER